MENSSIQLSMVDKLHDILANDNHVVAVFDVHGRRGNRILNERGVHETHLDDAGRIAEVWVVTDPKPHQELWGDAAANTSRA